MCLGKTCLDKGWGQGQSTCRIALGFNKEIAKSRPLGSRSKAFLSPGHCFLLFQALCLHNCLNTFWHEREMPWTPLVVMFVYAPLLACTCTVASWQSLSKMMLWKSTISFINRKRQNGLLFPKPLLFHFWHVVSVQFTWAPWKGRVWRTPSLRDEGKAVLPSLGMHCCQCIGYPHDMGTIPCTKYFRLD